jgi:hypothetical protein
MCGLLGRLSLETFPLGLLISGNSLGDEGRRRAIPARVSSEWHDVIPFSMDTNISIL